MDRIIAAKKGDVAVLNTSQSIYRMNSVKAGIFFPCITFEA